MLVPVFYGPNKGIEGVSTACLFSISLFHYMHIRQLRDLLANRFIASSSCIPWRHARELLSLLPRALSSATGTQLVALGRS
jgi:hypothetical protein